MAQQQNTRSGRRRLPYDDWMEAIGVPIYRGHFVEDLRNVELEWWEERKCKAAFLNLKGMEGVSEGRVQEIPAGETLPKLRMAIGELVYPLVGQGLCSVWLDENQPPRTFEWNARSLFHIPRHSTYQLSNARGDSPARLLHYNYLPVALSAIPDPDFLINNDQYRRQDGVALDEGVLAGSRSQGPSRVGAYRRVLAGQLLPGPGARGTSWRHTAAAARAAPRCTCGSRAARWARTCRCSTRACTRRPTATAPAG